MKFTCDLSSEFWVHSLDEREETLSQHLLLLLGWGRGQHGCGQRLLALDQHGRLGSGGLGSGQGLRGDGLRGHTGSGHLGGVPHSCERNRKRGWPLSHLSRTNQSILNVT